MQFMVIRGYPEEARRVPQPLPVVEEPPKAEPLPTGPVYYTYPPPAQLDPNVALITIGIVAAVGIVALAIIYKK